MVYRFIPAQAWKVNEVNDEEDDPVQVDMPVIVSDKNQELKDLPKFECYQYFF